MGLKKGIKQERREKKKTESTDAKVHCRKTEVNMKKNCSKVDVYF